MFLQPRGVMWLSYDFDPEILTGSEGLLERRYKIEQVRSNPRPVDNPNRYREWR